MTEQMVCQAASLPRVRVELADDAPAVVRHPECDPECDQGLQRVAAGPKGARVSFREDVEIELGLTANSHGGQELGWPRRAAAGTPGRGPGQKSDRAAAKPP